MNIMDLEPKAEEASRLLSAMANPKRLLILCHLLEREHNVGELAPKVGLEQPALSQHLAKLRDLGFVTAHREGQLMLYRLNSEAVAKVLSTLWEIHCK